MLSEKFKDSFKLILNELSPKFYLKFLKSRYFITNNMNIYPIKEYHADGTFATMWDNPPDYYEKWRASQKYNDEGMPLHAPDGSNKASAVPIVQYGLCEYGYYIHNHKDEHLQRAIQTADWLVRHQAENGGWCYEYDFAHPRVGVTIKAPWICGMAQGEGVGFLARMYKLTGNETYRECAEKALQPMEMPVEDGGVLREWNGYKFYEEYPASIPTLTINGFMYCLVGLHDFYELCGSEKALRLFDEGYRTLIKILPLYDSENTSYYDLTHITNAPRKPQVAGKYDPLHVALLQIIDLMHPHDLLKFYAKKWSWGLLS